MNDGLNSCSGGSIDAGRLYRAALQYLNRLIVLVQAVSNCFGLSYFLPYHAQLANVLALHCMLSFMVIRPFRLPWLHAELHVCTLQETQ
jgi:hypothetical protein